VGAPQAFDSQRWPRALENTRPVFVRSLFFGTGPHVLFNPGTTKGRPDRVAPLLALIEAYRTSFTLPGAPHSARGHLTFGELRLETPDTNDGKEVSGLCRAIERPLADALRDRGILPAAEPDTAPKHLPALQVLFTDGANVYSGGRLAP